MGFSAGLGFIVDSDGDGANDGKVVTLKKGANITMSLSGSTLTISGTGEGSSGTLTTVKLNGSQVGGADIVTLDFSSVFAVTESPDQEINIAIDDATVSAKGVASFSSDNFAVSSGAVTIKDGGVILGTETTGNYVATAVAGEGIDVSGATGNVTISGENATTSNKGIASFSSDNFAVSSGAVTIKDLGVDLTAEVTGVLPIANFATKDEDTMSSNSNTHVPTQQSVKAYVDSVAQGLDVKDSVRVATTGNISLANQQTIDGVSVVAGNRVLVKDQSTASQNGIYLCVDGGGWTRATDLASGDTAAGFFVFVEEGTANADIGYVCTSNAGADTVATHSLAFAQFSSAGQVTAGTGIDKSGSEISVDVSDFMTNGANNRVVTAVTADTMNGEANLTFTGSQLDVAGNVLVTQGATGGQIAFKIDNDDTDKTAFQIVAANINSDVFDIEGDAVTTANVVDITADALTTGSMMNLISDSASTGARELVYIKQEHASAVNTTVLKLVSDATDSNDANNAPVLHVVSAGDGATVRLESTDTDGGLAPDLVFKRTSGDPVDGDNLGSIRFLGTNINDAGDDALAEHEFADIYARANDVTLNTEDGELYFRTFSGGSQVRRLDLSATEVAFNEDGLDLNFRVESADETHMVFVDAANNRVSIGDSADAPASTLEITNHASAGAFGVPLLQLNSNDVDKIAVDINAANTTANVLDIVANAVTTASIIDISATALTTGKALDITTSSVPADGATSIVNSLVMTNTGVAAQTAKGVLLDYNKTGITASGKTANVSALHIDMDDSVTNVGTVTMTGLDVDLTFGDTGGTVTNIGLDVAVEGADENYGIKVTGGSILIGKLTDAPTDVTNYGQLWVDDAGSGAANTELYFTNDNGDDIQITDGNSLAVTGTVSEAFKTIAVSGQDSVVADGATDTLTLVGGTNIALTTSASGDSVTITGSGTISGGITVQEEGSALNNLGDTLNFVGSAVTATGTGTTKTITISGGGAFSLTSNVIKTTETIGIGSGKAQEFALTDGGPVNSEAIMTNGGTNSSVVTTGMGFRKNVTIVVADADTAVDTYTVSAADHTIMLCNVRQSDSAVNGAQIVRVVQLPQIGTVYVGREITVVLHGVSGGILDLISVKPAGDDVVLYHGRMWDNGMNAGDFSDVATMLGGQGMTMGHCVSNDVNWASLGYNSVVAVTMVAVDHTRLAALLGANPVMPVAGGPDQWASAADAITADVWLVTQVSGVSTLVANLGLSNTSQAALRSTEGLHAKPGNA